MGLRFVQNQGLLLVNQLTEARSFGTLLNHCLEALEQGAIFDVEFIGARAHIVAIPEKPIKSGKETEQTHVRELVECYSGDKQLLQQAIKDLEIRVLHKKQQIAVEKEVLKQLHERLANWGNSSD